MKVKLKKVRLSFPDLFEPVQYEGKGPFKYRASLLLEPKSENHKELLKAMKEVAKEEWAEKADQVLENANDDSKLRFIVDGNKKNYDGYAGMLAVTATRDKDKKRPMILHKNPWKKDDSGEKVPNRIEQTDDVEVPYAGCYVNAVIDLWAQNNKHGKTIRAQLVSVQFHDDGDAFGAGSAKGDPDDYEDLSETGDDDDLVSE
jgi:hypothetical protein